jgi:hypothetical protein
VTLTQWTQPGYRGWVGSPPDSIGDFNQKEKKKKSCHGAVALLDIQDRLVSVADQSLRKERIYFRYGFSLMRNVRPTQSRVT